MCWGSREGVRREGYSHPVADMRELRPSWTAGHRGWVVMGVELSMAVCRSVHGPSGRLEEQGSGGFDRAGSLGIEEGWLVLAVAVPR